MESRVRASWLLLEVVAFLGLGLFEHKADAHVLVYRRMASQLIEQYNDLPAQFGPSLPQNGIKVFAIPAHKPCACELIEPPPRTEYPTNSKFVAIIERGGGVECTFEKKVRNAQAAQFDAVIVYNNDSDDLEQMSAQNSSGIDIPSVFVGLTSGINLKSFFTTEVVLVINDELPFNINTQLILPFSILIGLCFLIMIFYMIYKCIREERRLRRHRLPKNMLKKLPILKYTKNNTDLFHETCAICLEDFVDGDKLRVLPCKHPYHSHCIDPWLTENRRICPICKRKVFTKREARTNRSNRQSSLDSVTDTDDDTTPLLPSANTNSNATNNTSNASSSARRGAGRAPQSNTRGHGTFGRNAANSNAYVTDVTSDDENALLAQQSPAHNARRVNPFDRSPNLPPHLAEQLSAANRSIWSYPIFRYFRRQQPISVAAPPFLDEVVPQPPLNIALAVDVAATAARVASAVQPASAPAHSSNNIMNPNLSGSFKDDEDIPHQSIYEPIAVVTPTAVSGNGNDDDDAQHSTLDVEPDHDSVFIQTPSRGGIGVAALPNTNDLGDVVVSVEAVRGSGGGGNGSSSTAAAPYTARHYRI